jgi:thiamine biosynthesis lipoprotein
MIHGWHSLAWLHFGLIVACAFAGEPALQRYEFTEPHMGTRFRIVLYAPDAATASRAAAAAFARITRMDDTMTDYNPDSELMSLSRRAGGPPLRVSEDLFRVLEKSQELAQRTNGAFDVTAGPVIRLWRRARRRSELPDPTELAHARSLVGYKLLRLDPAKRTAQLLKPGMQLDLGGIAKGFAADEALEALRQQGINRALVAGGGDIAAGAPPPGKQGWRIGIAPLKSPDAPPTHFLTLHDAGVSTSGDAEQYVEIGGKRYSHIIDPRTGQALLGHRSVTVVAPSATATDSLATAISVLGPRRGLELAKTLPGVGLYFVQFSRRGIRTIEWNLHLAAAEDTAPSPGRTAAASPRWPAGCDTDSAFFFEAYNARNDRLARDGPLGLGMMQEAASCCTWPSACSSPSCRDGTGRDSRRRRAAISAGER